MSAIERIDRFVVDAPIVLKWIFPEPRWSTARRILSADISVLAPDVILSHIGTLLSTHVRIGDLADHEADEVLRVVGLMPLQLHKTWSLATDALEIERRIRCSMPACVYLALALREDAVYLTANRELYKCVQDSGLAANIEWLGNLALC